VNSEGIPTPEGVMAVFGFGANLLYKVSFPQREKPPRIIFRHISAACAVYGNASCLWKLLTAKAVL
jgi:hypothetical protein